MNYKETGMLGSGLKSKVLIVLAAFLSLCLTGCGGSSGSADAGTAGFTISGKISQADGAPLAGTTVTLFKTSYTIYSMVSGNGILYGTKDSVNYVESVTLESTGRSVITDSLGNYSFTGVSSGNYTIQASFGTYLFKWSLVPTRSSIGVVTITDSGMVYFYNPDGTGNTLAETTILYNTGTPFVITDKTLTGQNFQASLPGSI